MIANQDNISIKLVEFRCFIVCLTFLLQINFVQAQQPINKNADRAAGKSDFIQKLLSPKPSLQKGNSKMGTKAPNCTVPTEDELKKILTPEQYKIVRENGTELPFQNAFYNKKTPGIYVDVISNTPLFSSKDKFDSGTGWPSFTKPIFESEIVEKQDLSHGMKRTEVRSKTANSHLGHLFNDGPGENGLRYCINSGSLKFIPLDKLESEGYAQFLSLFDEKDFKEVKMETVETAVFGGGCFWGVEELVRQLKGVLDVIVGYSGGDLNNPTYEQVKKGGTNHAEVVLVKFDPKVVSYAEVLEYFFRLHDPTTENRQGNDVGTQYRSVIFYQSQKQKEIAEQVKNKLDKSKKWKKPIVTHIVPAKQFWPAEEYHQDYLQKNPGGYTCHFLRD